jgi:hypothetical protein
VGITVLLFCAPSQSSCPEGASVEHYLNPKVAARIRALRSETEIMRYQRHFYEEALTKLQAAPGFSHVHARAKEGEAQQQEDQAGGSPCAAAPCLSPSRRRAVSWDGMAGLLACGGSSCPSGAMQLQLP